MIQGTVTVGTFEPNFFILCFKKTLQLTYFFKT
jgi:hypothetical protein